MAANVGLVHEKVSVSVRPETAFAVFAAHFGSWWPLTDRRVLGPGGSVAFEGAELVERRGSESSVWASVIDWKPPTSVHLAFFPRVGPDAASDLRLTFRGLDDGATRVTLEHVGWERLAGDDGPEAQAQVRDGWVEVLDSYRRQIEVDQVAAHGDGG